MRALVVDDATTIRAYYRQVLEGAGFLVDEAINGVEGLERAMVLPAPPDLLVVDVNMPRMDGYAFLRAIRIEPRLRGVPAMMISTEREAEDECRAYAAGANLFLVKPVDPSMLTRFALTLAGSTAAGERAA
jgi:two-component system chemotaxis response regulator CheY